MCTKADSAKEVDPEHQEDCLHACVSVSVTACSSFLDLCLHDLLVLLLLPLLLLLLRLLLPVQA